MYVECIINTSIRAIIIVKALLPLLGQVHKPKSHGEECQVGGGEDMIFRPFYVPS